MASRAQPAENSATEQTTSMIRADPDGQVIEANGEFADFAMPAPQPVRDLLRDYLAGFGWIEGTDLAGDADVTEYLDIWQRPDSAALEASGRNGNWRLLSSCPDPSGGMIFLSINIDRKKLTAGLADFVIENHPLPLWVNEVESGNVIYANSAANRLYNVTSNRKRRIGEFFSDENTNREVLKKLQEHGSVHQSVVQSITEDGREIWVNGSATLAEFQGRQVVISAIQDVTDRKEIDDDNRRARDLLRDAIESLSEGFALYDDDRRLIMCNTRYKEMNHAVADLLEPGLDWEILMRETARRGVYSDAVGREEEWVADRLVNGVEYIQDFELAHTDGTCSLVSVHPTNLGGFVVTRTDITAKKQAEAVERDGDLLVRRVLDACPAAVVMARLGDGEIIYRSPAAVELFGKVKSAKEFYVSPLDRADYVTTILSDGRADDFKLTLVNARGSHFPASLYGRLAEYKGDEVVVTTTIDLTEQNEADALIRKVLEACPVPIQMTNADTGRLLFRSPETTALFGPVDSSKSYYAEQDERDVYLGKLRRNGWVNDHRVQLINGKGNPFWGSISARLIDFKGEDVIVSNTRDMTGELALQEELSSQREMLFQNEKMSALGELLAGVAHELNNPLSIVVGHALMLREEASDPETLRRIEKISSAAERSAKIVKTFLAMARQQPTRMERIDIQSVISTAVDVAGYGRQGETLEIVQTLPDDLPDIVADSDQITQVIINLVINAEQAIAGSGTGDRIDVSARLGRSGDSIEIVVEDNGPGVPDKIKGRVFEPFFTTKEVGDGTGIGLAFCHRIIHSHGGQIWLDQDYATGCRFVIALPLATAAVWEDEEEDVPSRTARARRVLVVDDEPDVAELVAEILKKEGFAVDLAASGADALRQLEDHSYDVVLSDLNMPGVDGRGLYEGMKNACPDLAGRIAFITGDTMGAASQKLLKETRRPHLEKPVSPAELRELVYGLLNGEEREG